MPIKSATSTELNVVCGKCKNESVVSISDLTLSEVDMIFLPGCSCGATECLMRTWDKIPEKYVDSAFSKHRKVVNAVVKKLIQLGKVENGYQGNVVDDPPDLMSLDSEVTIQ